jgi:hypothetical protein
VTACRRATLPTRRCPSFVNATTDGVVREPSAFGMTTGSPFSTIATHEFVVPRSMPITALDFRGPEAEAEPPLLGAEPPRSVGDLESQSPPLFFSTTQRES